MVESQNDKKAVNNDSAGFSSSKPLFSWSSPDYILEQRGYRWYVSVVVVTLILLFFLYLQKIYSGMILVTVFSMLLVIMSRLKPKNIASSIFSSGVVVDGIAINFSDIKSFGVVNSIHPKIKLRQNGKFGREINMPVAETSIEKIRQILLKYLPEEELSEDLSDVINRIIKF